MKKFDKDLNTGWIVLSFFLSIFFLILGIESIDSLPIIISIIFAFIGVFLLWLDHRLTKKENENRIKERNNLKLLYQSTKNPVLLGNTYLRTRQAQTRQILTGTLTYAQPKEYSLHINCTNISDKTVTAVEIEVKTLNAFNEQVSSFVVSTRKQLLFGNLTECSWDLSGSFDINNAITKVKRVMFSDGTTWNNK